MLGMPLAPGSAGLEVFFYSLYHSLLRLMLVKGGGSSEALSAECQMPLDTFRHFAPVLYLETFGASEVLLQH